MGIEVNLAGMNELLAKLETMGANISKIESEALKAAAKPVLEEAKATSQFRDRTGELRKGLKISGVKSKGGVKYVLVGIDQGDTSKIFYGKFLEWGTSKLPAHPFLGPALEHNKSKVSEIIMQKVKEALE